MSKLSQKEKNLIFLLAIIIILIVSYRFGYMNFIEKADAIYNENVELKAKLSDLQIKASNQEKYIEETENMQEDAKIMLDKLSASISQSKSIMYITELEAHADIKISAISFADVKEIYSSNGVNELKGYQTNIVMNYQTNYAGLKKTISHINDYYEKMRINSLTAAFDNTTGNLTGSISIDRFALTGDGRELEAIKQADVNIGSYNIFGSFELPLD